MSQYEACKNAAFQQYQEFLRHHIAIRSMQASIPAIHCAAEDTSHASGVLGERKNKAKRAQTFDGLLID